jgi:polyribonucleotide nucleotidyltransferase
VFFQFGEALMQSEDAKMLILDMIESLIPGPRKYRKPNAPKIHSVKIELGKIGALVGSGGQNIKRITEISEGQIAVNDYNSGKITAFAPMKIH